ncbi:MAG TPA: aldehyde ferredoxin oxidoreductase N-terminal domain-containing protein [Coriobacteriia bacterium]
MATGGYAGKILRLDLTARTSSAIETEKYAEWGGGHGIGSALFWDLCKDKTVSGLDPANVVTIMTSPLSGTMVPSASGRVEVQGIGATSYPINWFTRSNFGGRFGGQLKYAGWDGIVLEGKADKPVWIDIVNDKVVFRDAAGLWGKDTQETQKLIWKQKDDEIHGWTEVGKSRDGGRTTQKPAIITTGPAGENLSTLGCLVHDAGNAAGQGGFGAVFGSKNLKAISVVGTGSVEVADPAGLFNARLWAKDEYAAKPGQPAHPNGPSFGVDPAPVLMYGTPPKGAKGPQACQGCINGCRARFDTGIANESSCQETSMYKAFDVLAHGKGTEASFIATDLVQKMGVNSYELMQGIGYLYALGKMGVLGAGKEIDTDLDMSRVGEADFAVDLITKIAYRQGIGEDLAHGFVRAAEKWGRLEKDFAAGILDFPYWGYANHGYDPRAEIEWGYGSIMGERDMNLHCFNTNFWSVIKHMMVGKAMPVSAEEYAKIASSKMVPYAGDTAMLDFSTENIYSESIAKLVVWQGHYGRFWKQSALYCDFRWPDFTNYNRDDNVGITGDGEPKFWNAVTGQDITFAKGIELGRRIFNLDNAIWALQGRHRDIVKFASYIYDKKLETSLVGPLYPMAGKVDGKWEYINCVGRSIDRAGFEEFKTRFYALEGWDSKSGWPTRETLKGLDLENVADVLEEAKKLGVA